MNQHRTPITANTLHPDKGDRRPAAMMMTWTPDTNEDGVQIDPQWVADPYAFLRKELERVAIGYLPDETGSVWLKNPGGIVPDDTMPQAAYWLLNVKQRKALADLQLRQSSYFEDVPHAWTLSVHIGVQPQDATDIRGPRPALSDDWMADPIHRHRLRQNLEPWARLGCWAVSFDIGGSLAGTNRANTEWLLRETRALGLRPVFEPVAYSPSGHAGERSYTDVGTLATLDWIERNDPDHVWRWDRPDDAEGLALMESTTDVNYGAEVLAKRMAEGMTPIASYPGSADVIREAEELLEAA